METKACPILDIENPADKPKAAADATADVESQPATIPNPLLKLSDEDAAAHWGRKQWNAILCEGSILIHRCARSLPTTSSPVSSKSF